MGRGATRTIADYVAASATRTVHAKAVDRAKLSIMDGIAVAMLGATRPIADALRRSLGAAHGECRVIGTTWQVPADTAAFLNGALIHSEDWDDLGGCGGHPTATILPPLLAISESRRVSGEQFIRAYVTAYEAGTAIARNMTTRSGIVDRPWHPTAVIGPLAATCAASALLGLGAEATSHALGIAASMSGGLRANFGTHGKPLQVGHASWAGYVAAILADSGATADTQILERANGFASCYAPAASWKYLAHDLTDPRFIESDETGFWTAFGPGLKPWPCCGGNNTALTALEDILAGSTPRPEDVRRVTIEENVNQLEGSLFRADVRSDLEGKFSLRYNAALLLLFGNVTVEMYDQPVREQVTNSGLLDKIVLSHIDEPTVHISEVKSSVSIEFVDGSVKTARVCGRGRTLNSDDAESKARLCASRAIGEARAAEFVGQCERLEDLTDASNLLDWAVPRGARGN